MPGKRRFYRRKARKSGLSKTARAAVTRIVDTRHKEYNYIDVGTAVTNITSYTVPLVYNLLGSISVGSADNGQRQGDKIYLRSIHLNMNLIGPGTDSYNYIRVLIFQVKDAGFYSAVMTDILNNPSTISQSMVVPYHHDNRKRFNILLDKTYSMNAGQGLAALHTYKRFPGKGLCVQYAASGTAPIKNTIYMAVWSDWTGVGTAPGLAFNSRCHYLA